MDAAWQLGNRIDNIRHRQFLAYLDSDRAADTKLTTLFRFANYFGWREFVRREVQLLRFEDGRDTRLVAGFINDVAWVFSTDTLDAGRAMLWADEQRGIGELMIDKSAVKGHAAFHREYSETFAEWMERFAADVLSKDIIDGDRLRLLSGLCTRVE